VPQHFGASTPEWQRRGGAYDDLALDVDDSDFFFVPESDDFEPSDFDEEVSDFEPSDFVLDSEVDGSDLPESGLFELPFERLPPLRLSFL
jgi:hypothetical protein